MSEVNLNINLSHFEQEGKKNHTEENENLKEELEKVRIEAEQLKTTKELIEHENEVNLTSILYILLLKFIIT